GSSDARNGAACAVPNRHATRSSASSSGNATSFSSTSTARRPDRSMAAHAPSTVDHASIAGWIASYHSGGDQPCSRSAVYAACLTGWLSSRLYVDASTTPRRAQILPPSRRPSAGSSRWLKQNDATTASNDSARNG